MWDQYLIGGAFRKKLVGQNGSVGSLALVCDVNKNKNLNDEISTDVTVLHCKGDHTFRARNPLNLTKFGVAEHKVGGAAAPLSVPIGNSTRVVSNQEVSVAVWCFCDV